MPDLHAGTGFALGAEPRFAIGAVHVQMPYEVTNMTIKLVQCFIFGSIVLSTTSAEAQAQATAPSQDAKVSTAANTMSDGGTSPVKQQRPDAINVVTLGADPTGHTDSTEAFRAARAAAPSGGTIRVPAGKYFLSSNPFKDFGKSLTWDIAPSTTFSGANTDESTGFGRLYTNAYSQAAGPWIFASGLPTAPAAGTTNLYSIENVSHSSAGYPVRFTATVTKGSSILTNVSNTTGLYPGVRLRSAIPNWPGNPTPPFYGAARVASVHANTIVFSIDSSKRPLSHPYSGPSASDVVFEGDYFGQSVGLYVGIDSNGNRSGDNTMVAQNIVANIRPGTGNGGHGTYGGLEIDVNNASNSASQFGILLTGGNVNDRGGSGRGFESTVAMRVERGHNNWITGINIKDTYFGLNVSAQNTGLIVRSQYTAPNGSATPSGLIGRGIYIDSAPDNIYGPNIVGGQFRNGYDTLWFNRASDKDPAGSFLRFRNHANTEDIFLVDVDGNTKTSGNLSVGTHASATSPVTVSGPIALKTPSTINAKSYSQTATDASLIFNGTGVQTITLLTAAALPGQILRVKNVTPAVVRSASGNVVPLAATSPGTAILGAGPGKFAVLQSDGVNWVVMESN